MRQAQTLNEAQLRRVIHYCRSRRHPIRDETIILVSFYAGLRAKEIAALTVGNIFDEDGAVRTQFILSAQQSKGGQTRTVYLNQRLRKALREYGDYIRLADPQRPLFASQKGGHFSANTMCQLFLDIYKAIGLKDASSHSVEDAPISPVWQTRVWAYACLQLLPGIRIYPQHRGT